MADGSVDLLLRDRRGCRDIYKEAALLRESRGRASWNARGRRRTPAEEHGG